MQLSNQSRKSEDIKKNIEKIRSKRKDIDRIFKMRYVFYIVMKCYIL